MIKRIDTENDHAALAQIPFNSKCLFTQGHKKSSYDKIVAAFSFSRKTIGKHIDFENSLIFRYTWHHIIPSKACKQGFSEYQNNVGKQRFHKIT